MIIDANAHITEDGKWFNSQLTANAQTLLKQMDSAGVDKAVLVPFHGITSNDYIINTVSQYPDRFIAGCSINPVQQTKADIKVELTRLADNEVRICKLHNRLHKYEPSNNLVYDFLELNEGLEKPMIISICGILANKNISPELTPVQHFHKLTSSFPNTIFIIMHAAGTHALSLYEAVKDNPNVYLDLSFTISKYKGSSVDFDIAFLIEKFDRRLIWGSDFPEFNVEQSLIDFNKLATTVADSKKRNILSSNLLTIL
jgi:predicted TIM-barrel fold metal-dependent hydrolase